jgi:hypothetical protein
MGALRRLAKVLAWSAAGLVYIWFAAVRNADAAKARKAARRRERLERRARLPR